MLLVITEEDNLNMKNILKMYYLCYIEVSFYRFYFNIGFPIQIYSFCSQWHAREREHVGKFQFQNACWEWNSYLERIQNSVEYF